MTLNRETPQEKSWHSSSLIFLAGWALKSQGRSLHPDPLRTLPLIQVSLEAGWWPQLCLWGQMHSEFHLQSSRNTIVLCSTTPFFFPLFANISLLLCDRTPLEEAEDPPWPSICRGEKTSSNVLFNSWLSPVQTILVQGLRPRVDGGRGFMSLRYPLSHRLPPTDVRGIWRPWECLSALTLEPTVLSSF